MRKLLLATWAFSALAFGGGGVYAADSVADAKAELERKQKERAAARAEMTQITVGELEDLRDEVRRLELENAALKGKAANAAAKPPVKRYTAIEVGMTRDELLAFVKSRSSQYRIGGMNVEAGGVQTEREQYIESTKRSGDVTTVTDTQRVVAVGRKGAVGTPTQKNEAIDNTVSTDSDQLSNRTIERRRLRDKKEKIKVEVLGYKSAVIGTERSAAGTSNRMGRVKAVTGAIHVSLTNDVVTGMETQGTIR